MATFPSITPTYGMRKTSKPKVRVSTLGDGYEFRALYGLPLSQDPKVYDLTFNVSELMIRQVLHLHHQPKGLQKQVHIRKAEQLLLLLSHHMELLSAIF